MLNLLGGETLEVQSLCARKHMTLTKLLDGKCSILEPYILQCLQNETMALKGGKTTVLSLGSKSKIGELSIFNLAPLLENEIYHLETNRYWYSALLDDANVQCESKVRFLWSPSLDVVDGFAPVLKARFDLVYGSSVLLSDCRDFKKALTNIKDCLTPQGKILFLERMDDTKNRSDIEIIRKNLEDVGFKNIVITNISKDVETNSGQIMDKMDNKQKSNEEIILLREWTEIFGQTQTWYLVKGSH